MSECTPKTSSFKLMSEELHALADSLFTDFVKRIASSCPADAVTRAERHVLRARAEIVEALDSVTLPDFALCPNCRAEIEENDWCFCPHCLHDMRALMHHCECGAAIHMEMAASVRESKRINYCSSCGRPASAMRKGLV